MTVLELIEALKELPQSAHSLEVVNTAGAVCRPRFAYKHEGKGSSLGLGSQRPEISSAWCCYDPRRHSTAGARGWLHFAGA